MLFCDASFADDIRESKSTSGCYLAIVGSQTFVPTASFSKRQGVVNRSFTEAEIISLEEAVRSGGLSVLTFWERVVLLFGEHRWARQSGKHDAAQSFYKRPAHKAPARGPKTARHPNFRKTQGYAAKFALLGPSGWGMSRTSASRDHFARK